MTSKQDEIAFSKMLNNFEAAIETDLNHRNSEAAKKWEFDFSMEQPMISKNLSWQSVSNNDEATTPEPTRPRVQLKPRMSIGALTANKPDSRFSNMIPAQQHISDQNSIFGISHNTESTAADSMFSGSLVGINSTGLGSNVELSAIGGGFRTSIVKNMNRRATLPVRASHEDARESDLSTP